MSNKTILVKGTHLSTITRDFGVRDAKGRTVGARIITQRWEVKHDEDALSYWPIPCPKNGELFTWAPQSTRDDEEFGASQKFRHCETVKEMNKQIVKYIESSRQRALKNFTD